ncbi:hypothetical protein MtrunA17_Chr2g0280311 [Medicago truncatula]|uniref:CAP, cysteine-rich secretory protein, antigen 5 n=1 Tax=Medicago truncatula TaxID=3880 RepID=G7IFD4_MEDTR|nr:pathogenesis-related protein 1B [Medicago truncatula]AES63612.1 CAP, cysteine-rich secretory protein, antigen 5 [Medicago truncatula]RHN71759.1 hypothetical protein MtrunA17_Chr2g0280311 [Medicago truncatula]
MGSFSLLFLLGLTLIMGSHVAHAQDSPADYVNAHNNARSAVHTNVKIPNIVWDNKVAAFAKNYANQRKDCQLVHSGGGGRYGENIAESTGNMSGVEAVKLWVDEKPYYDYSSNSCANGEMCGHYTQVVWRNTQRIGCAKVKCNNGGTFITCNYDPPGNYIGERPY